MISIMIDTSGPSRHAYVTGRKTVHRLQAVSNVVPHCCHAVIHKAGFYRERGFDAMSVQRISIAPEYVSFYVAGLRNVDIPVHMDKQGVFVSDDCVNIPAYYWSDGDTHVTLGPYSEVAEAGSPNSDSILNTPNNEIILFDANNPQFAIAHVPSAKTRIRVWMDHPIEPSNVVIAWG